MCMFVLFGNLCSTGYVLSVHEGYMTFIPSAITTDSVLIPLSSPINALSNVPNLDAQVPFSPELVKRTLVKMVLRKTLTRGMGQFSPSRTFARIRIPSIAL